MPLHTTDALILRTYKLGESDRIVVFLTRDRGKKRGVAKKERQGRRRFGGRGGRRSSGQRRPVAGGGPDPLPCGRLGFVGGGGRELVRLDYAEPIRSPL